MNYLTIGITSYNLNASKFFTLKNLFYEMNELLVKDNKNKYFLAPIKILIVIAWK